MPSLHYSDVVVNDGERPAIVWWRRQAIGTELQGSARILADESGVLHEKIAYFSRLPREWPSWPDRTGTEPASVT